MLFGIVLRSINNFYESFLLFTRVTTLIRPPHQINTPFLLHKPESSLQQNPGKWGTDGL